SYAGGAGSGCVGADDRGAVRFRRNHRSAGGLPRSQCAAVRFLHARHADGRPGPAAAEPDAGSRANSRASRRQLLPLHWLSGDHRRRGKHRADARGTHGMTSSKSETLSALDRPNSYIGKTVPRPNLDRLLQGRAQYVSDMELPRMAHVVFVRSPHAHAKINGIDASAGKRMPGTIAVVTGQELASVITPWVGVLSHLKGLKSAPQSAIAVDRVCWQGEAVAAIVATSRAAAEDAAERAS